MMMPLDLTWAIAQDLIKVIFDDIDSIWLKSMWDNGGTTQAEMAGIIISLALFKLRISSIDLL
jgi:hypothetical protein